MPKACGHDNLDALERAPECPSCKAYVKRRLESQEDDLRGKLLGLYVEALEVLVKDLKGK